MSIARLMQRAPCCQSCVPPRRSDVDPHHVAGRADNTTLRMSAETRFERNNFHITLKAIGRPNRSAVICVKIKIAVVLHHQDLPTHSCGSPVDQYLSSACTEPQIPVVA